MNGLIKNTLVHSAQLKGRHVPSQFSNLRYYTFSSCHTNKLCLRKRYRRPEQQNFCLLCHGKNNLKREEKLVSFCYGSMFVKDIGHGELRSLHLAPLNISCNINYLNFLPNNTFTPFQRRHFRVSDAKFLESKVEQTANALKEKVKDEQNKELVPEPDKKVDAPKKNLWNKFVDFVKHYYHGFRLLFIDIKICSKLIWQLLKGGTLSRREYRQLVRTTADMFRLLPLLVFILVPFAEFLLPVALKLFPNILPSTFEEEKTTKEKNRKTLVAKIEMAKFLQNTIEESALQSKGRTKEQTLQEFSDFITEIRKSGIKPRTKDIRKFAKLFENEIALDNLSRSQLRACCTLLSITPIGSDALLRFLLRMRLRNLYADDLKIVSEGINTLTISELQSANRERGMRALGVSEIRLREQLSSWIKLHVHERIPTSLLLLSRALYLPETLSVEEKIGTAIVNLAETADGEAKLKAAELSGEKIDNKTKLEIIKHEEEIIAAEKEQKRLEAERLEREKENKLLEDQARREMAEARAAENAMNISMAEGAMEPSSQETLVDKAKSLDETVVVPEDSQEDLTAQDLDQMEVVLEEIAKTRDIDITEDSFKDLKEDVSEYKEDLEDLKDLATVTGETAKEFDESVGVKRLSKKVDKMISRLDNVVTKLQIEKGEIEDRLDEDKGGVVKEKKQEKKISEFKSNIITINEMLDALKRLQNVPDDAKMRRIFQVLDQDKDGNINITQALKVLELLSREHLNLSESQLEEVHACLKREAQIEQERKEKEKLESKSRKSSEENESREKNTQ